MKFKNRFSPVPFLIVFFVFSQLTNGLTQEIMKIKKKDNSTISIPTADIAEITFSSAISQNENTVTDADGNVYKILRIGNQIWMGENLKTTKFSDGKPIPHVSDNTSWANTSTGAYCWYANTSDNKQLYGALYNWYTVASNKLCPEGWRVPTDDDWNILVREQKDIPGAKLKEMGVSHWKKNTANVTNQTKFTALPAGTRFDTGNFSSAGTQGTWWTATANGENEAYYRGMYDYTSNVSRYSFKKKYGLSVRCIKN